MHFKHYMLPFHFVDSLRPSNDRIDKKIDREEGVVTLLDQQGEIVCGLQLSSLSHPLIHLSCMSICFLFWKTKEIEKPKSNQAKSNQMNKDRKQAKLEIVEKGKTYGGSPGATNALRVRRTNGKGKKKIDDEIARWHGNEMNIRKSSESIVRREAWGLAVEPVDRTVARIVDYCNAFHRILERKRWCGWK